MVPNTQLERSKNRSALHEARTRLRGHRLYRVIRTPKALRTFVEHHVICVLDFMSLVKSLQFDLTCTTVPWTPVQDPDAARLIQSIVLDEETDVRSDGRVQSHFEWYCEAMEELGADLGPIRELVDELRRGRSLADALDASRLPAAARAFGRSTASFLPRDTHVRAAVFLYGREEVIPEMFLPIVDGMENGGVGCEALRSYLVRHVEIDGGTHGPLAEGLLDRLCQRNAAFREEAEVAALEALEARVQLWDAIAQACEADDVVQDRVS